MEHDRYKTNRKYSWEAMLVPKRTRSSRRVSRWLMSAFRFELTAKMCRMTIIKSWTQKLISDEQEEITV